MPNRNFSLLLALALLSMGCRAKGVSLATYPAGANVVVDGEDSGFSTPCVLNLDSGNSRRIDFELPGYTTATRMLVDRGRRELVYWRDATVNYNTWNFPLWLNLEDFFVPSKNRGGKMPGRVFVRLRRQADTAQ